MKRIALILIFCLCLVKVSYAYFTDTVMGRDSDSPQVVYVGDSLTLGYGGSQSYDNYIVLSEWGGQVLTSENIAVSGDGVEHMYHNADSNLNSIYNFDSALNIVVVWGGTNDIAYYGTSVAQTYSYLREFCQHQRKLGWRVFVLTMASRIGYDMQKNQYNELIRSDWDKFADGLVDIAENENIGADGAYTNETYFSYDGIHLTEISYIIIAEMVEDALNTYIEDDVLDIPTITQQNTIGGNDFIGAYPENHSQGFKVSSTDPIVQIDIPMKKQAGAIGVFNVYIYNDDGIGKPNAQLATFSPSVDVSALTTSFVTHSFTGSFTPVANTQYHIVVLWTGGSGSAQAGEDAIATNPYANGHCCYNLGSGWVQLSSYDMVFAIYQED